MKQVQVDIAQAIKGLHLSTLTKDLTDDEQVCPHCHGLGIVPVHYQYGVSGDTSKRSKEVLFPYDNESFILCPYCYNGVQRLCHYCGKPIEKGWIEKCDCEGYKKQQEEKRIKKWTETVRAAKEITPEEVGDRLLYCKEIDEYFESVDDFLETCEGDYPGEELPEILWVTEEVPLELDAWTIVEDATEDSAEEVFDNCDIDSLQKLLDEWIKKQTGTDTYFPYYEEYVRVIR